MKKGTKLVRRRLVSLARFVPLVGAHGYGGRPEPAAHPSSEVPRRARPPGTGGGGAGPRQGA